MFHTTNAGSFAAMQARLAPLRKRLLGHPIYGALRDIDALRTFMQHHVFAVWDFMSLLKALQRELTEVGEVWRPRGDPHARRLINEIVLGEESDLSGDGFSSHFELYLRAMRAAEAGTEAIDAVLESVGRGDDVMAALAHAPAAARRFSTHTFATVRAASLPAIAAAFTIGREDVIPAMFTELVRDLHHTGGGDRLSILVDYLDRHIELDGDHHGPMSAALLASVCGDEAGRWTEAERAAESALLARMELWDGVMARILDDPKRATAVV